MVPRGGIEPPTQGFSTFCRMDRAKEVLFIYIQSLDFYLRSEKPNSLPLESLKKQPICPPGYPGKEEC